MVGGDSCAALRTHIGGLLSSWRLVLIANRKALEHNVEVEKILTAQVAAAHQQIVELLDLRAPTAESQKKRKWLRPEAAKFLQSAAAVM